MATAETLDDRLQKVKDDLKEIYSKTFGETKGGKDEKREACCAIHDQLTPSKLFPSEFSIDSADRDGRNDPETAARTSDVADSERKAMKDNPMATPEKLQNKSLKPRKLFDSPPEVNDAPTTVKVMGSTATTTTEIKIDFKRGRKDPEHLKQELKEAVARKNESAAEKSIKTFVDSHIIKEGKEMLGPVSVSMNTVEKSNYREYIPCKVIELSLAGQVVWETEDGKAAEGTTNFWEFNYSERRLIEAAQLYSSCKTRNVPLDVNLLLPVMYWKEGYDEDWVMYRRGDSTTPVKSEPPSWATAYLDSIKGRKYLYEKMQLFPKEEVGEPNKHHNAVYLLLCRFKKGVPEEYRVQAYAGKATNGVETRWLQHAADSKKFLESYKNHSSETFSAEHLKNSSLLVDVLVARLYAEGGREYLTDNDNEDHDNIALFVYHAYGEKKTKKKTGAEDKRMVKKENKFIKNLQLKDMKYGLNLKGGSKKNPKSDLWIHAVSTSSSRKS